MALSQDGPAIISKESPRRPAFVIAGLAIWLLLFISSTEARFYSDAILAYFAGGYSNFKPLFAIAWLLACACVVGGYSGAGAVLTSARIAAILVFAGQLNTLLMHVWFTFEYHLSVFEPAHVSTLREISSNQLIHIHAGKGILYLLLQLFGLEQLQQAADPGRAFAEVLPVGLFVLHGALILGAGFFLLRTLRMLYGIWPRQVAAPYAVAYAISSEAVIRCILDGGPLDSTNMVLAPVLFLLLLCPLERPLNLARKLVMIEGISFCALWLAHSRVGTLNWGGVISNAAIGVLFVCTAALGAACVSNRQQRRACGVLFAISLAVLCALSTNTYWSWEFRRALTMLQPGDTVYIEDFYDQYRDFEEVAREGKFVLRKHTVSEIAPLKSVYKQIGMKIGLDLVNVSGRDCDANASYSATGRIIVINGDVRERTFANPIVKEFDLTTCTSAQGCDYRYQAKIRGCTPNSVVESIINRLSEMGLDQFIIVPDWNRPK